MIFGYASHGTMLYSIVLYKFNITYLGGVVIDGIQVRFTTATYDNGNLITQNYDLPKSTKHI